MKKTAKNDITGAWIVSKPNNEMFEKNFDLIFGKKEKYNFQNLKETIKENNERIKEESRIDVVGQNGNDGLHYEYELDKSTGEVIKKDTNG